MAQLPRFQVSAPNLNALFQPLQSGLNTYRQGMDRQTTFAANEAQRARANALANSRLGLQREQMAQTQDYRDRNLAQNQQQFEATQGIQHERLDDGRRKQRLQQAAGIVQMIQGQQDPAQREAMYHRLLQSDPDLGRNVQGLGTDEGLDWILARTQGTQGSPTFGRTGAIFQDPNGNFYTVQFGNDGSRKILPIGEGLAPAKGVTTVDTGTGTAILDKATGGTVRSIDNNVAEAERQKIIGREGGKLVATMPKAQASLNSVEASNDIVLSTIERALPRINNMTAGFAGTTFAQIPGTEARDVSKLIDTIKANIGFDKLQDMRNNSPTGGALGQVSERELAFLQGTIANLEQSQTPGQLRANLLIVQDAIKEFRKLRRRAFEETYAPVLSGGQPAAPPALSGTPQPQAAQTLVFDPESGELRPK